MATNINFVEDFSLTPGSDDTVSIEFTPGGIDYGWPTVDSPGAFVSDGSGNISIQPIAGGTEVTEGDGITVTGDVTSGFEVSAQISTAAENSLIIANDDGLFAGIAQTNPGLEIVTPGRMGVLLDPDPSNILSLSEDGLLGTSPGGGGQVDSVVGSDNITIDADDPVNPAVLLNDDFLFGDAHTESVSGNQYLSASWDGTNSSVALQHNGEDVLVAKENFEFFVSGQTIPTISGNPESGGGTDLIFTIVDFENLPVSSIQMDPSISSSPLRVGSLFSIRRLQNNNVFLGSTGGTFSAIQGDPFGGTSVESLTIEPEIPTGTGTGLLAILVSDEKTFSIGAPFEENSGLFSWSTDENQMLFGAFNAPPVPQPVLPANYTLGDLAAAIGATSGLGLVEDSASPAPGGGGTVDSIVPGPSGNLTIDDTDPANPIADLPGTLNLTGAVNIDGGLAAGFSNRKDTSGGPRFNLINDSDGVGLTMHLTPDGAINLGITTAGGGLVQNVFSAGPGEQIAFFGETLGPRPVVTGSRSSGDAYASLLDGLAAIGFVDDQSTA